MKFMSYVCELEAVAVCCFVTEITANANSLILDCYKLSIALISTLLGMRILQVQELKV